jgi:D-amino-acid dehydrogenase
VRILISFRLRPELESLLVDENVFYRPDLQTKNHQALGACLVRNLPDVIIVRTLPAPELLRSWRAVTPRHRALAMIALIKGDETRTTPIDGLSIHIVDPEQTEQPEIEALLLAESLNRERLARGHALHAELRGSTGLDVILIGGGIVNLVTAYYLVEAGYQVRIFDSAPDPARTHDWRQQGCTFGGGDARIFSLNEGRHHHHKGYTVTETTNSQFSRLIQEDGWLIRPLADYNAASRAWIDEFGRVPQWLSGCFDRDIISFNQESAPLWRQMIADVPQLFTNVGFHDGLLRLYANEERYRRARLSEQAIGAVIREINLEGLAVEFPSLRDAVEAGFIAGALEVVGFSLNVQKFGRTLGAYLAERGAELNWNTHVERVLRDGQGRVRGLQLHDGAMATASHYVLSPGAFGNGLLRGFRSEDKIASVAGMWLTLPELELGLDRPLKISRQGFAANGAAEGANVIAGTDAQGKPAIHISSGHGYLGTEPAGFDCAHLDDLARAVDETARQYFPRQYKLACECGMVPLPHRYCVRPWTPSGLGLFEMAPSVDGGLAIVTGGHNTGGYAQAPSTGQAVVAALAGRPHPMHVLYDPARFTSFNEAGFEAGLRAAQ